MTFKSQNLHKYQQRFIVISVVIELTFNYKKAPRVILIILNMNYFIAYAFSSIIFYF